MLEKFFKVLCTAVVASVLLLSPLVTEAQGLGEATNKLDEAVGANSGTGLPNDLSGTIATVVQAVLSLVGTIFLLLTIYAGILWMTAQGEEDKIEKAQKIIKATIIGLFITMAAYAITFFVANRLSGVGTSGSGTGAQKNLDCAKMTASVKGAPPQCITAQEGQDVCAIVNRENLGELNCGAKKVCCAGG